VADWLDAMPEAEGTDGSWLDDLPEGDGKVDLMGEYGSPAVIGRALDMQHDPYTVGERAADIGRSFGAGSNALLGMVGTGYGLATVDMDNWARRQGEAGREYWSGRHSDELKARQERMRAEIEGQEGFWNQLGTTVKSIASDPVLLSNTLAEQAPNLIATGIGGRVAGTIAKMSGKGAVASGAAATGGAVGTGAALHGSDVGGESYDQLLSQENALWAANEATQKLIESGVPEDQAKEQIALELSRWNALAGAVTSAGLNLAIPGARSVERVLGGGVRGGMGGARGAIAGGARGLAGESITESAEEGTGKILANLATQQINPEQMLLEGAGEATGQGAIFGLFGAGAGAIQGAQPRPSQEPPSPENPVSGLPPFDRLPPSAQTPLLSPQIEQDDIGKARSMLEDEAPDVAAGFNLADQFIGSMDEGLPRVQAEQQQDRSAEQQRREQEEAAYRQREQAQRRQFDADYLQAEAQKHEQDPQQFVEPAPPNPVMAEAMRRAKAERDAEAGQDTGEITDAELIERLEREINRDESGDQAPEGEQAPAEGGRGAAARNPLIGPVGREQLPEGLDDPKLMRRPYRAGLLQMTRDLTKGGGIALVPAPGATRRDNTGDLLWDYGTDQVVRSPSVNPMWFQSMAAELKVSTDDVKNAVNKALEGKRLGSRQTEVISQMLGQIETERLNAADGTAPETWQEMLAEYREAQRIARGERSDAEIDALGRDMADRGRDLAGFRYANDEYLADMDAEARALYDLFEDARALDEAAAIEIMNADLSEAETVRGLWQISQGERNGQGNQAVPEDQGPGARERQAQQGQEVEASTATGQQGEGQDLAGAVDQTAQAQSDADRARQQRADQAPDMIEGEGELFAGPRPPQSDMFGPKAVEGEPRTTNAGESQRVGSAEKSDQFVPPEPTLPRTSEYGRELEREGFENPSHEQPGLEYTNVHDQPATVDPDRPYMLVTYRPEKSEQHFKTVEQAIDQAPAGGDWQVLNAITGEIHREPATEEQAAGQEAPLDQGGSPLQDLNGVPVPVNEDGTITLYHRTTPETAQRIRETGRFVSAENTNEAFFSTRAAGYAEGYGDATVEVRADPSDVRLDDAFQDGEIHVAAHVDRVRPVDSSPQFRRAALTPDQQPATTETPDAETLRSDQRQTAQEGRAEEEGTETRGQDSQRDEEAGRARGRAAQEEGPEVRAQEARYSRRNLNDLLARWSDRLDLYARESGGVIRLDKIVAPRGQRSRGLGTEFMQELTDYADRTGQRIAVDPSADFGASSVGRLKRFYRRFGFRSNTGRNRDFEISEAMVREPEIRYSRQAVQVPRRTWRWMGFDQPQRITADFDELARRHPEHYGSEQDAQADVEFVLERPENWYPHAAGRITLVRQGELGQIPAVRVDFRRMRDGSFRVASVYRVTDRQIAKKMREKKGSLDEALGGNPAAGALPGSTDPGVPTVRDYLEAEANRSSLPEPSSEDSTSSDDSVPQSNDSGQRFSGTTEQAVRDTLTKKAQNALLGSSLVNVTNTPADWPGNHPPDAAGAWINGEIWLATDNIAPGSERGLILHEVGVHHGLESMMDEAEAGSYKRLVRQIKRQVRAGERGSRSRSAQEALAAHRRAQADETLQGKPESALWEETIAYMAEGGATTSKLKQIIAEIRRLVRKFLSRYGLARDFSANDIAHLARGSVQRVVDGLHEQQGSAYAPAMYSFAGVRAETADRKTLVEARDRLRRGDDPETIRKETGWFRGPDKKWRFEINDSDARYLPVPNKTVGKVWTEPLERVIDHPALFAAYPELRDMTVRSSQGMGESTFGRLDRDNRTISINADLGARQQFSTLLHEIQHGIQHVEGFATGGSPRGARDALIQQAENRFRRAQTEVRRIGRQIPEVAATFERMNNDRQEIMGALGINPMSPHADQDLREIATPAQEQQMAENRDAYYAAVEAAGGFGDPTVREFIDAVTRRDEAWKKTRVQDQDAFDAYHRLAGEVEARNTQERQRLGDRGRRMMSPEVTQDVRNEDVVVMFNGKIAENAPVPANASADQTQTPEFRRWFGNSRVVDADGNPLVVYHGSAEPGITEFEPGRREPGSWFTTNRRTAGQYVGMDGDITSAYLRAENPMVVEFTDDMTPMVNGQESAIDTNEGFAEQAERQGYDSVHFPEGNFSEDAETWVVFDPTQIKSATGNVGTFDPDNPDIRYSRSKTYRADESGERVKPGKEVFTTTAYMGRDSDGKVITVQTSDPSLDEQKAHKKWAKKLFTKEGLLHPKAFARHIETHGIKNEIELDTQFFTADFTKAARRAFGQRFYARIPEADRQQMNEYLAGREVEGLDQEVRDALDVMRGALDRLSGQVQMVLIDEVRFASESLDDANRQVFLDNLDAALAGDEQAIETIQGLPNVGGLIARKIGTIRTIESNKGEYLNRSYRVFDDEKWSPPAEVIERAREFLNERVRAQDEFSEASDKEIEDHVEGIINAILRTDQDGMVGFLSSGLLGQKDLSILKRRKDIAPEIRELMGEHTDPRMNFARSLTKMGSLVANHHFLSKVREDGLGEFLSTRESGRMSTEISSWADDTMVPLSGLYATPEFAKALRDFVNVDSLSGLYKQALRMNSAVKYGKTVLSPTTSFRNFYSASMFTVMNGHFDWRHSKRAAQHTWADLFSNNADRHEYLKKLVRLGVLHDNPRAGEMRAALEDVMSTDPYSGNIAARALKGTLNVATKIYRAGDDFWKIIGFENEKQALVKSGMNEAEAEAMAADRIRNGYPTYSMVPESVRWLRRFPGAGTFVSFPWEIARTTGQQFRIVREDLAAGRTSMAARRMVGMATAGAGASAVGMTLMAMFGIDDEEDEAIREMAAPWQRNAQFAYMPPDEEGNIRYLDLSHLDPYAYLKLPVRAVMNGNNEGVQEKVGEALKELLGPFLGPDIAATAIGEVAFNQRLDGGEVYDESASKIDKAIKSLEHLRKGLQPGIAANIERSLKALHGEVTSYGKEYKKADEALGWIGFRLTTADPETSLKFRGFDFNRSYRESRNPLYRALRNPNPMSEREIRNAVLQSDERWKTAFRDVHDAVRAVRVSGLSDFEIRRILDDAGIPNSRISSIVRTEIPTWRPTSQSVSNARRAATRGRNARISPKEFEDRMRVVRETLRELRRQRRDSR